MGLGIPPLRIKITLESNPLKSTMLVGGLAAPRSQGAAQPSSRDRRAEVRKRYAGY